MNTDTGTFFNITDPSVFGNNEQVTELPPSASAAKETEGLQTGTSFSQSIAQRQVSAVPDRYQERHELQKQALECRFGLKERIESEELLKYLLTNKVMDPRWIKEHSEPEMLAKVLSPEVFISTNSGFYELLGIPFTADQYLAFSSHGIRIFQYIPAELASDELFLACLKRNPQELNNIRRTNLSLTDPRVTSIIKNCDAKTIFNTYPESLCSTNCLVEMAIESPSNIPYISATRHDYIKILKAVLKKNSEAIAFIPVEHLTDELVDIAVSAQPAAGLGSIPKKFLTKERCEAVIRNGNKGNLLAPLRDQNEQTVPFMFFEDYPGLADLVVDCSSWAMVMPDSIKTEERIARYLENYPDDIMHVPQTMLENNRPWCKRAVRASWGAMKHVPEKHKDYEFCLGAVRHNSFAIAYISESLLIKHPDIPEVAVKNGGLYFLPETMKTEELCRMAVNVNPYELCYVPKPLWHKMPLWVLASEAPESLPLDCQQHILEYQDTCYLPELPSAKLSITTNALLKPLPPNQREDSSFFSELKKQILACKPFQLRNRNTGGQLQDYIASHHARVVSDIKTGHLPRPDILTDNAEAYGGRALLCENPLTGTCERYKFLRKGEPLADFTREGAVHSFCHNTDPGLQLKSQLHSEVPIPGDYCLIAKEVMPDKYIQAFKSELETVLVDGKAYYVCYQFSTNDRDYSTLAHQTGANGDAAPAEGGILKAAHDLGVWSSCGAVHTSTIKAYHSFRDHRKELFLVNLFSGRFTLPGGLSRWNTWATDESDWGWTGLRDIGDMEFYPFIDSYTGAHNADFTIPGYAQRCSFLEGFTSNMVAAVLHYARLHQNDLDYHYSQPNSVEKMAQLMESVINSYLSGLTGTSVEARHFFESNEVYSQWLRQSALETLYWTAPQSPDRDCISAHLAQEGKCASSVYPDSVHRLGYYHMKKEVEFKTLGLRQSPFGLTWLVRGLGLLSGGIAERLQPSE